jgi:hypothetical protein
MFMSDEPKKYKRKKITPKAPSQDTEKVQSDTDVKDLISEILSNKLKEVKKNKGVEDINNALVCTISEFLDCFMLLGYNSEGVPIALTKSNTPIHADALHSLLMKFFSIQMGKFNDKYGGDDF